MGAHLKPDDRRLLGLALDLARQGLGRTSPNPMVGALVVRGGEVLGSGFHRRAGDDHAETVALREAGVRAEDADLYVSLEPCCHQGRTPPCVERIIAAGIRRVVAAARDPNRLVDGRGFRRMEQAGVEVAPLDQVFVREHARLNEVFVKFITTRKPFVALKAGMSLDGKIAPPSRDSKWITSEVARTEARTLRSRYDAVLVGIGTVLADDPVLVPARARAVLDSQLRLPPGSRLAATARDGPVLLYAAAGAPAERAASLEAQGVTIVRCGIGRPSIPRVLDDLARREITSVLVEGGGEVLGSFLRAGEVDAVHLFVAPRLLGGRDSVAVFGGSPPSSLAEALALGDWSVRSVGEEILIEARPRRPWEQDRARESQREAGE